jgi:hypothetical protein
LLKNQYDQVKQNDQEFLENCHHCSSRALAKGSHRDHRHHWLTIIAACITVILVLAGAYALGVRSRHNADVIPSSAADLQIPKYACGTTVDEARALGCKFDVLAAAWMPEACLDEELTEEFRNRGPWQYFADASGKVELSEEELSMRVGPDGMFWTTQKWHVIHCAYQWRKMHRAMQSGRRIESSLADYAHTKHCGHVFLDRSPLENLLTEITVEYLSC